jgi:hypothetical protein
MEKLFPTWSHWLQINIPKQTEEIHWLSFSPVEEHFYRRTYIECSKDMLEKLRNFSRSDIKLSEMDRKTLQVTDGDPYKSKTGVDVIISEIFFVDKIEKMLFYAGN